MSSLMPYPVKFAPPVEDSPEEIILPSLCWSETAPLLRQQTMTSSRPLSVGPPDILSLGPPIYPGWNTLTTSCLAPPQVGLCLCLWLTNLYSSECDNNFSQFNTSFDSLPLISVPAERDSILGCKISNAEILNAIPLFAIVIEPLAIALGQSMDFHSQYSSPIWKTLVLQNHF